MDGLGSLGMDLRMDFIGIPRHANGFQEGFHRVGMHNALKRIIAKQIVIVKKNALSLRASEGLYQQK